MRPYTYQSKDVINQADIVFAKLPSEVLHDWITARKTMLFAGRNRFLKTMFDHYERAGHILSRHGDPIEVDYYQTAYSGFARYQFNNGVGFVGRGIDYFTSPGLGEEGEVISFVIADQPQSESLTGSLAAAHHEGAYNFFKDLTNKLISGEHVPVGPPSHELLHREPTTLRVIKSEPDA